MDAIMLPKSAFRKKLLDRIEQYLSLSDKQTLSVGLYIHGQEYVVGLNEAEEVLSYDIGSVSKTLTAHLILKLAEQGLVELDRPVSAYIELKKGSYPTIYELLTHTAGYGHQTPLEITMPMLLSHRYSHRNPYEKANRAMVLRALNRRNRKKKTYHYGYSDFSYAILAIVAERVAHEPFDRLMEKLLRDDLQLQNTFLTRSNSVPSAVCRGREIPYWHWERENPYIAAGGMVSNIFDMLKYVRLQIESDNGYIVKAHAVCENSFPKGRNIGTCLGWHTYRNSDQLWHVGGVSTFRTSLIANKRRGYGVAVCGNAKGVNSANVHYIAKMLYSEMKLKKINFST